MPFWQGKHAMANAERTKDEIDQITAKLIELGLSDDQNFPILTDRGGNTKEVIFDRSDNFSLVLRNIPYSDVYKELKRERDYNLSLADGALIQLQYTFEDDEISRHRLAFLPSPDLTVYQNDPDFYAIDMVYAEVIEKNIVPTPVRFDFDRDSFVEYDHPMSHLTIGQYKNCRIPVSSAISPYRFFEFILGSFYNTAFMNFRDQIARPASLHPTTITVGEAKRIHVGLESSP